MKHIIRYSNWKFGDERHIMWCKIMYFLFCRKKHTIGTVTLPNSGPLWSECYYCGMNDVDGSLKIHTCY